MKKLTILAIAFTLLFPILAIAKNKDSKSNVSSEQRKAVEQTVDKISAALGAPLKVTNVSTTPIPGLLQVTSDLSIFYITADGKFVISGEMIDIAKTPKEWSLTETAMRSLRKDTLAGLDTKDMIIFPAKDKKIGTITVFTDLDCHYCKKLQENISEYSDQGIEIRYLAFPRSGPGTKSFEKAVTVWCDKNKPEAYSKEIAGKDLPSNQCANNMVGEQFELGRRMGINGTPTMIFDNGIKIGGLVSAKDAAKIIKEEY